eukprot:jgi/Ulvmu1/11104/UM070_0020.1
MKFTGVSGWFCISALLAAVQTGVASDSIARCKVSLSSEATSQTVAVAAEAVASASAFVCGGKTKAFAEAEAIAEASATAVATAVARATAECFSKGKGSFEVNGKSLAVGHAEAYAEAFAAGFVEASVCDKCAVSAAFVADSYSKIIKKAIAEAEIELVGSGDTVQKVDIFVEAVVKATAIAFASVLVEANANAIDEGCDGLIIGVVATGDPDDPDGALCIVSVSGQDEGFAKSAVAEAAIDVSSALCGSSGKFEDAAVAIAAAVAKAVAEVTLECEVVGNGFACAAGSADVVSVAKAVAKAIAKASIDIIAKDKKCGCEITLDALLEATETIVAKASADAYAAVCSGKSFFVQDLETQIRIKIAIAIADVLAKIKTDSCSVDLDIGVSVDTFKCKIATCVKNNRKCYGGGDVSPCCTTGYTCKQRPGRGKFGMCVKAGSFNDWTALVCTKA